MPVLNPGTTFANGEQLTASDLNLLLQGATFTQSSVDNQSTQLVGTAIVVADGGIIAAKLAADAVTTSKILDANVTFAKLTDVIDDDTMATATDTTLATSKSIKAYVDGTVSTSENGYMKLPSGVIMQWGTLTPSVRKTDVTLPIAFPNACLNVQASIGQDFADTNYDDNSLIWGAFPKSGDLSRKPLTPVSTSCPRKRRARGSHWLH
jgi:hypothetical protein